MKKQIFILLAVLFMASYPVFAQDKVVKTTENAAIMRSQSDAIISKWDSLSFLYQAALDNLVVNLLPEKQLKKLDSDKEKLKTIHKSAIDFNIKMAEIQAKAINNYLKSPLSADVFKNLSVSQKYSVTKDLKILMNVLSSYEQVGNQAKSLTSLMKIDSYFELSLGENLKKISKIQTESAKQVKNINKLMTVVVNTAAESGVLLK